LPLGFAGATVLAQILYPLTSGGPRNGLTVLTVLLFAAASLTAAWRRYGRSYALVLLAVTAGVGFVAEAVGVATGLPFGDYAYAGTLGPRLLGVPLVIPLAWTMMAYPALLLGRRLTVTGPRPALRRGVTAVLGGATLAAWDLFLDPQMVAAGHWTWLHPRPGLPGVPGVPLTNFAGWLLVGVVMTAVLDLVLPAAPGAAPAAAEALPAALLAWTWLGSVVANLAFFGRPWVGLYGGLALGVLVVPYLRALAAAARSPRRVPAPQVWA
jgi:putative membrane protein